MSDISTFVLSGEELERIKSYQYSKGRADAIEECLSAENCRVDM